MATKTTESSTSVEKGGAHHLTSRETTEHILQLPYAPHAPLTDEVRALARNAFLKFDLILVLPMVTMLCECWCKWY
jgi:hypothetical protein